MLEARFVTTAVAPEGYPDDSVPEVAFVGRSNVGKSSMINRLAGRKKLVRTSNTPGRTRTLNFFDVELRKDEARRTVRLADLPGYGFAKVSKAEQKSWEKMITAYLKKRVPLKAVVSIVDAEVGVTPDDLRTLDFLLEADRKILLAATKIDRLPKAKRKPRLSDLSARLELPREAVLAFSATEGLGRDETWDCLWEACFP